MQSIDNKEFGQFLVMLRKEKGLTQKQLADLLFLSDKAVSKWERGLSLPDISLLMPLAKILDVTTTELLSGKRIQANTQFTVKEVDLLMSKTITLSKEESDLQNKSKLKRILIFISCLIIVAFQLLFFVSKGYTLKSIPEAVYTVELLMLIFGIYFTFFVKEMLPVYYDENKINQYRHGAFRMNVPGVAFNNSNWKYVIKAVHISIMSILIIFPLLYLILFLNFPLIWEKWMLVITLCSVFIMFVPIYIVGKKFE